jgi:adenine-specific DNA-methyltransferase
VNSFEKLKAKLAELFQLDQADLDFGIYRIMNARREEIVRFLDKDLLPQVREAFAEYKSADKAQIQAELEKVIEGLKAAGVDPEQAPKVKELRGRLANEAVDITALENEVYDHLCSFFGRYYDEGDFISLRRYKEGVYAIPYEGEEVKLHWANADQYYIKTAENFRDYAFKVAGDHRVHFKIAEADTEKDNVKAANGKDRRFLLHGDKPVGQEAGELVVRFEYRPDEEGRRQDAINALTAQRIIEDLNDDPLAAWQHRLSAKWVRADGSVSDKTVLERHLEAYTKKNTFDYFIHKDLGGFLRRELDFYIKNEVMRLDDIEEESAPRVEQYLAKIKALRRIAHKIIDFLAQIENFQKKLWLKKKFVVETNYCVTLDRVPEELYPEIAANDAQREEWVRLFAIDQIKAENLGEVAYSEPLSVEFLDANASLVLDTALFPADFKDRLLATIGNFDDRCAGLLVHSENLQALRLIKERYRGQVGCIYIDPPYNTDASPILYKNGYKSSTWVSLVKDRLCVSRALLADDGVLIAAIDDEEQVELSFVLSDSFRGRVLGTICVRSNPSGRPTKTGYSVSHEYLLFAGRSERAGIGRLPPTDAQMARFNQRDDQGVFEWRNLRREGSNSDRSARRGLYYPIFLFEKKIRIPEMHWEADSEEWKLDEEPQPGEQVVYPDNEAGDQKTWRWEHPTVTASLGQLAVRKDRSGREYVYYKRRPHEEGVVSVSSWFEAKYSATEHGTALLKDMFGRSVFTYPKSIYAVTDAIYVGGASNNDAVVVDYFAGSGTTGHAVIALNRKYGGTRKYVLVEMGDYFDTVLLPRVKKAIYAADWDNGLPLSRSSEYPHVLKYIRLESYEDALANIELRRTRDQQTLLDEADGFRESYMLRYMLDGESRGSQTLLNIENFDDPFRYKLLVGTGSAGETRPVNVDLVETFNWLLGLKVRHIDCIEGFRIVEGTSPKGERVLVIWRKIRDLSETDPARIRQQRRQANEDLDAFFRKQQYNTLDSEYDLIYVNGDNNLMNIPLDPDKQGVEPRYKVRLIEEEFGKLMFDVKDV